MENFTVPKTLKEQINKHVEKATRRFLRQEDEEETNENNKRAANDTIDEEQSSSKQRRTKSKDTNETENDIKMDETNIASKRSASKQLPDEDTKENKRSRIHTDQSEGSGIDNIEVCEIYTKPRIVSKQVKNFSMNAPNEYGEVTIVS